MTLLACTFRKTGDFSLGQWLITRRLCVSCWEPDLKERGVLGRLLWKLQSTKKLSGLVLCTVNNVNLWVFTDQ